MVACRIKQKRAEDPSNEFECVICALPYERINRVVYDVTSKPSDTDTGT